MIFRISIFLNPEVDVQNIPKDKIVGNESKLGLGINLWVGIGFIV